MWDTVVSLVISAATSFGELHLQDLAEEPSGNRGLPTGNRPKSRDAPAEALEAGR